MLPTRHHPWAELLQRVFEIDALCYPRCGGRMRTLAAITAGAAKGCLGLPEGVLDRALHEGRLHDPPVRIAQLRRHLEDDGSRTLRTAIEASARDDAGRFSWGCCPPSQVMGRSVLMLSRNGWPLHVDANPYLGNDDCEQRFQVTDVLPRDPRGVRLDAPALFA